jgi:hypothetical protein
LRITWNTDVNAPCCPGEIVAEDGRTYMPQPDFEYPAVAQSFGWSRCLRTGGAGVAGDSGVEIETEVSMNDMNEGRVFISADQAIAMLPDGDEIHTFRSAGSCLIGADWPRAKLIAELRASKPELAGEQATAMKHGLCLFQGGSPLFIRTKD